MNFYLFVFLWISFHKCEAAIRIFASVYHKVILAETDIEALGVYPSNFKAKELREALTKELTAYDKNEYHTLCQKSQTDYSVIKNLQVSPFYLSPTPELTCYTDLRPDLAFGGSSEPGPNDSTYFYGKEDVEFLTGINRRQRDECTHIMSHSSVPTIIIDLGEEKTFSRIVFTDNYYASDNYRLVNADILYSSDYNRMDLSQFTLIMHYNPADLEENGRDVVLNFNKVTGRFIAIKKNQDDYLMICNLQVFLV